MSVDVTKMPKLGFGLMRLPEKDGELDLEQLCKMVDAYMTSGMNYFDTAYMYCGGKSESIIKKALVERYPRDSFTLTTKLPQWMMEEGIDGRDRIFNEQLARTGAGYFDYYLLHDIGQDHYKIYNDLDCFNWIMDKKEKGLVKHVGFSFHDNAKLLDKVLTEHPEMEFVQLQINYLDWDSEGIQSRKCYEVAKKHNKPVIVMEPVKGGTLAKVPDNAEKMFKDYNSEASIPSWAIRFAASHENVKMVLSGMSNMEQLMDNMSYMKDFKPLNNEEQDIIMKAIDVINSNIAIPCTGCSYCTEGCPMKIAIPKYFSLFNADLQEVKEKGWTPQGEYYDRLTHTFGKASDCVACGQCEKACPQHLSIIEDLKKVAEYFGK